MMRYALLASILCLAACGGVGSRYSYFRSQTATCILETVGNDLRVAAYDDGALFGAEAPERIDTALLGSSAGRWQMVDHPDLAAWREQLARMEQVAGDPASSAEAVVDAGRDFPFRAAREDAVRAWWDGDAVRAGAVLDCGHSSGIGRDFAEALTASALRAEVADDRAAGWMGTFATANWREAALHLVREHPGVDVARVAMTRLGEFSSDLRLDLFEAASARVDDPVAIVEAADALRSRDEARALDAWLARDTRPEAGLAVLRALRDRSSADRSRLFRLTVPRLYRDPDTWPDILGAIDTLRSSQRYREMRAILDLPEVAPGLVQGLVENADELGQSDRERFLLDVVDGPHFEGVRAAVETAVRGLSSSRRRRVQERIAGRQGEERR